ncbi:LuxR C-terminal-related transcriptional regulator [Streptomyces avermitilis]|uniref:LuxR C-terminal-related transcriptional regulator n=1 Tax=Streptomyces avermitilis TaxID=33903 RepID=UPI0033AECBB5
MLALGRADRGRHTLRDARDRNLRLSPTLRNGRCQRNRLGPGGSQARSRALLSEGDAAERLYREAIAHFTKTRLRVDLARAHLLYGEWLRRERRRNDAREQLRTAHGMLETRGMTAFAERADRELRAAGGTAHQRTAPARHEELTAQEGQMARMARDGLSNPEIGIRLSISARTVQYHLRKVFTKLGITGRRWDACGSAPSGLPTLGLTE